MATRTGRTTVGAALGGAAALLAFAASAAAQAPREPFRVFVMADGGLQALTRNFSRDIVFTESGGEYREVLSAAAARERARLESRYRIGTGVLFDVSGGFRIAPRFGLGIGVSRFDVEGAASVTAQAPHPFHRDRDRTFSGASAPLARRAIAVHLQAFATAPLAPSVSATFFAGPTLFDVRQQLVADVNFTHEYPYDMAAFSSAVTERQSGAALGFHLGADVTWYFSAHVGVGGLVRYSKGTLEFPSAGGGTLDVEAGGLHAAGGLRLRF